MNKLLTVFFLMFLFFSNSSAQTIIENDGKPLNQKAGRILKLEEVLRIEDKGSDFYFKSPLGFDIACDGSVFLIDEIRLYKFGEGGRFEKNLVEFGQGPGEVSIEITNFLVTGDEIIIFCGPMKKIIRKDLNGKFKKEFILRDFYFCQLLAYDQGKYFMVDSKPRDPSRKDGINIYDHNLIILDENGNTISFPYSFPTKNIVTTRSFKGKGSRLTRIITRIQASTLSHNYIYLSHTEEYLILQFDIEKQKIVRGFRRKYSRQKSLMSKYHSIDYCNDINGILVQENKVLILTSTFNKEKGILVDVFDDSGRYIDNFYLPLLNSKTGYDFPSMFLTDYHKKELFI